MGKSNFSTVFCFVVVQLFCVCSLFLVQVVESHKGHDHEHEHDDHSKSSSGYTYSAGLKKSVGIDFKWLAEKDDKEWVTMEMSSKTGGYVSVGFCEQWHGTMKDCDIVIGGVDDVTQQGYLYDCYATENGQPTRDTSADYHLVSAEQKEGLTTVVFKRKWNTNDTKDANLENNVQLIWSWNPQDVTNPSMIPAHDKNSRGHTTTMVSLKSPSPSNSIFGTSSASIYSVSSLLQILVITICIYTVTNTLK